MAHNQPQFIGEIDVWKFLVLDWNTWNYISLCKLFVLQTFIWHYDCLQIIIISETIYLRIKKIYFQHEII